MHFSAASNRMNQFTGKERDTEAGLDYFMARYFSSAQGRFTSPDPLLASARLTDPQTWNRYAYVRNDPVNMVDPDGMDWINASVYQGLRSTFLTGDMFNSWFQEAMGVYTISDYNFEVTAAGMGAVPGFEGVNWGYYTYLDQVNQGQAYLAAQEAQQKTAQSGQTSEPGQTSKQSSDQTVTWENNGGVTTTVTVTSTGD